MNNDRLNVPAFYTTWKAQGSAAGLRAPCVYAPYGLSTEWPDNSPLRTLALRNTQTYRTYNFSVAWQVAPDISAGLGVTYNHATTDLNRAIGIFGPNDLFRFAGSGSAVGFDLGLLWKVNTAPTVWASATPTTPASISREPPSTIPVHPERVSRAREFKFPENVIVGWSYRPNPQWNIEADADWTNWNRLGTVVIHRTSGDTVLQPSDWRGRLDYHELGATRYFDNGWHVSAGYCYTENSTPDSTYTPAVPDSNRSFYSLGYGYRNGFMSAPTSRGRSHGDGGATATSLAARLR